MLILGASLRRQLILLLLLQIGLARSDTEQPNDPLDSSIVNAIVNGIAASGNEGSLINAKKDFKDAVTLSKDVQQTDDEEDQSQTISVIMNAMLPSMFGLFSNITSDDYKATFEEPCRFDSLMALFRQLPPYFDLIAKKYPGKPDLIAYYSMQLASTFLVNNGSLTMACMYNMLSLQTRLNSFSLDIMDKPEENSNLVGLFGVFMKPVMTMLKKNAMMKIIEHVDRYDKNDDRDTIFVFHLLNFLFVVLGVVAILSNMLLIILLRRSSIATKQSRQKTVLPTVEVKKPLRTRTIKVGGEQVKTTRLLAVKETRVKPSQVGVTRTRSAKRQQKLISKYKTIKSSNSLMYYFIRKRYKTRVCVILIAVCHSLYILINFIVMSQASLAAVSLKGLSQFNVACKMAFFLFPPTTAYNILHQMAIWLLFYAIRQHGLKLRKTRTFNADEIADHDIDLMKSEGEEGSDEDLATCYPTGVLYESSGHDVDEAQEEEEDDEDTVSVSLTNNSNNLIVLSQQSATTASNGIPASYHTVKFKSCQSAMSNNYHQILNHQRHPISLGPSSAVVMPSLSALPTPISGQHTTLLQPRMHPYAARLHKIDSASSESCLCYFFSYKRKNAMFCLILFILLCLYDGQNLFLYSLFQLTSKDTTVYFCAFESAYAEYYSILTQLVVPLLNLILFSILPMTLCTMQVLFDVCFLLRVQREQMKRFEKLKEVIEWPLYAYFGVYVISQVPYAIHQLVDLCIGTTKFPFVFPLFIQLKFTSKVWLSVFEMSALFVACAADFYIWIICDKQMRQLAVNWLNKRLLCRTYKPESGSASGNSSNANASVNGGLNKVKKTPKIVTQPQSTSSSRSSNNSRTSEVDSSSTSSSFSSCNHSDSLGKSQNIKFIKQTGKQQQPVEQLQQRTGLPHSYASSTVSSSVSPTTKKPISPIIQAAADTAAATAKAAAAISASMSQPTINEQLQNFEGQTFYPTRTIGSSKPNTHIKMIDTDIDDIDDLDLDPAGQPQRVGKVFEEKDSEIATLPRNEVAPPSFNTATRNSTTNANSSSYRHEYQNDINFPSFVVQR